VTDWLLGSGPSIRWQVMRDLLDAPESEWTAERAKVETKGWGASLLSYEDADGQWAAAPFFPAISTFTNGRTSASRGQPRRFRCHNSGSSVSIPLRSGPNEPSN